MLTAFSFVDVLRSDIVLKLGKPLGGEQRIATPDGVTGAVKRVVVVEVPYSYPSRFHSQAESIQQVLLELRRGQRIACAAEAQARLE